MNRHWLRTIIRMLNTVQEQLGEFRVLSDSQDVQDAYKTVYVDLRRAISRLNDLFDTLQKEGG